MQLVIGASIVPVAFRVAVGLATDTGIGVCNSVCQVFVGFNRWSVCAPLTRLMLRQLSIGRGRLKPLDVTQSIRCVCLRDVFVFGSELTAQL